MKTEAEVKTEAKVVTKAETEKKKDDTESSRGNFMLDCIGIVVVVFCLVLSLFYGYDWLSGECCELGPETEVKIPFFFARFGRVVAAVSFVAAILAVYVTMRVNETVQLHSFNMRYGNVDMHKAINTIADVGRRWEKYKAEGNMRYCPDAKTRTHKFNPKGIDNGWIEIFNRDAFIDTENRRLPWTASEDAARRQVKNYFSSALELYRTRSITKRAFRNICDKDAITLFFKVIEPMESLMNEKYHYKVFYETMKAAKKEYATHLELAKAHDDHKKFYLDSPGGTTWVASGAKQPQPASRHTSLVSITPPCRKLFQG